ncbi:conserved domain protein [Streptococcus sp. oral taxon 056 str. F0418]|nr:conserved domain protein [Streptococcus sp. oral taxon 056 str. F0418]
MVKYDFKKMKVAHQECESYKTLVRLKNTISAINSVDK